MGTTEQLVSLLAHQQEVLTRLQQLCRLERESLLSSQLDRLEAIIQEQEQVLATQARLSSRITVLLKRMALDLSLTGAPTLACVAAALQGPDAEAVRGYFRELSAMADAVQHDGRVNWYLSQQAIKYVEFTLKLIGQSKEGPLPYLPSPQAGHARPMQFLLDNHA